MYSKTLTMHKRYKYQIPVREQEFQIGFDFRNTLLLNRSDLYKNCLISRNIFQLTPPTHTRM